MPVLPDALERLVIGRLNALPGVLLDYAGALAFRAAIVATRIGVFNALRDGPADTAAVARATGCDPTAIGVLLEALAALGYVRATDRWELTPLSRRWLVESDGHDIVAGLDFLAWNAFTAWDDLEATLRAGRPSRTLYESFANDPAASAAFQAWDLAAARLTAPAIVARIPLPRSARRIVDLGGGNGYYSVLLCRRSAALTAVVVDAPVALTSAERLMMSEGTTDRIALQAGDILVDDFGADFDLALIANVVHGLEEVDAAALVQRAAKCIRPGGRVVVVDQLAGRNGGSATRAVSSLLALNYVLLLGGHAWPHQTIESWLEAAGLRDVRLIQPRRTPGTGLILGTRG